MLQLLLRIVYYKLNCFHHVVIDNDVNNYQFKMKIKKNYSIKNLKIYSIKKSIFNI